MSPLEAGSMRLALAVVASCLHAAGASGASVPSPSPIRWDLALIHGLEASAQSLGIRDRIRVVTLGTSGCTPRSATLFTINPESGSRAERDIPLQGRAIEFEVEGAMRTGAVLEIQCLERGVDGGPTRTFTLALDPTRKAR